LPPLTDQFFQIVQSATSQTIVAGTSALGVPYLRAVLPSGQTAYEFKIPDIVLKDVDLLYEFFRNLDDGHYQILLRPFEGAPTERLVMDVYVRQGQVIDFADIAEDQAGPQPEAEGQEQPQGGAGDQGRLEIRPERR